MQPGSSEGESPDSNRRDSGGQSGHVVALGPDIAITYLPIPDSLRGLVMTLFHFRCDLPELSDMFPAMTGFVSFTLKGTGWTELPDGQRQYTWPATLVGPSQAATRIGTQGAFHTMGAILSPLGWARLTGLHAAEHSGAMYNAAEMLGPAWAIWPTACGNWPPGREPHRTTWLPRSRGSSRCCSSRSIRAMWQ